MRHMKAFLEKKDNAPGAVIEAVHKDLHGSRSIAQIRVKVNNLKMNKQKPLETKQTDH